MRSLLILSGIIGCQAVFTPTTNAQLRAAIGHCVGESNDGNCPIFEASNDNTGNPYGPIGTWDVSQVTNMDDLFRWSSAFNQDVSNWEVSQVTRMFEWNYNMLLRWRVDLGACTFGSPKYEMTNCGMCFGSCPNSMKCKVNYNFPPNAKFSCGYTCDPGSYRDWSNGDGIDLESKPFCSHCPTGTYQDENNQGSCKDCTMGKYHNTEGQVLQSSCNDCPLGKYQNETGQSSCKACPSGKSSLSPGSMDCFTATEIKQKFVETQEPALVPAYNIANSCG